MTKAVAKQNTPKGKSPFRKSLGNSPKNTPNKKFQAAVAKTPTSAVKQTPKGTPRPQANPAGISPGTQVTGKLSRSQRRKLAKKRKREQLILLGQGSAAKGNSNKKQVIAKANGVNKNAKAKNEENDDDDDDEDEDESDDELGEEDGSDLGEEEESDDEGEEEEDSDDDDNLIKTEAKVSKNNVDDDDDSEDDDDEDDDDSEDDLVLTESKEKKLKNQTANKIKLLQNEENDNDDDEDDESDDDEEENKGKKTSKESAKKKENPTLESIENTVFIANLGFKIKEEELKEFFESKLPPNGIESVTLGLALKGRPKGYGFVKLINKSVYEKALKLSGEKLNERPIVVKPAVKRDSSEMKPKPKFIRIKGVLNSVTDGQILKLVVTKVKLESISSYNRRRGAGPTIGGMVELVLGAEQDYEKIKQLNGSSLGGRAIDVSESSKPLKNLKSGKSAKKFIQSPGKQVGKNEGKGSPNKSNSGKFQGKGNKNQNKQNLNKGPKQGVKRGPQGDFNKSGKSKKAKVAS